VALHLPSCRVTSAPQHAHSKWWQSAQSHVRGGGCWGRGAWREGKRRSGRARVGGVDSAAQSGGCRAWCFLFVLVYAVLCFEALKPALYCLRLTAAADILCMSNILFALPSAVQRCVLYNSVMRADLRCAVLCYAVPFCAVLQCWS
jgi:hypothetical protein